jgi:hypothetical protein
MSFTVIFFSIFLAFLSHSVNTEDRCEQTFKDVSINYLKNNYNLLYAFKNEKILEIKSIE